MTHPTCTDCGATLPNATTCPICGCCQLEDDAQHQTAEAARLREKLAAIRRLCELAEPTGTYRECLAEWKWRNEQVRITAE